ncbi:hypothetical protein J1N44_17805 [Acidovorax temperans]|uniref:hypothetical protein n=1 Tax=Acidovorax temperans TaxID=80878 RepID=UPI001A94618B|nr:hypothetical protein [Acidovorax temperans]MBO0943340.1 hypothetical protein [Acidovorax temperans]MBO0943513.1 hypothetical protein [Acidovorax temperans]
MNQDEIIAMAREEGLSFVPDTNSPLARIVRKAVAKEREACAKVCDELAELNRASPTDSMWQWGECAAAIRARGQKEELV